MRKHLVTLRNKSYFFLERHFNLHITPAHFNSPIPTMYQLKPETFTKKFISSGLEWNELEQLKLMDTVFGRYLSEFAPQPNSGLSLVDAFILYAMIRDLKPLKMVEIGSGESTKIALRALEKNRKEGCKNKLLAIEPYPSKDLEKIQEPSFTLIKANLQDVDINEISDCDLLFIDSSHISKIGSDVNYQILEIVPSLKDGAVIHWHDIFIPHNYPNDLVTSGKFWNETYMVHAFLLFNRSFKVLWASHYMQTAHEREIASRFDFYLSTHRLSSFWVRKER